MAFKFIVNSIMVPGDKPIDVHNIMELIQVYDEKDLDKAISYCKHESDKDRPNYKIDVETVFEEHAAYKSIGQRLREKGTSFGNVPYAKYIVRIEILLNGQVDKHIFIKTITFHNIL